MYMHSLIIKFLDPKSDNKDIPHPIYNLIESIRYSREFTRINEMKLYNEIKIFLNYHFLNKLSNFLII